MPRQGENQKSGADMRYAPGTADIGFHLQKIDLIAIGASTGGVSALETVLAPLGPETPPIVIAQHMPAAYLARLAEHFLTVLMLDVILVTAPCRLRGGTVHLAASDGWHMALSGPGAQDLLVPVRVEPADLHVPSIDTLFGSIARSGRSGSTLACLMTGMASDGACGLRALRDGGAETWVEDPRTANVPSMPEAAISRGAACRVLTRQAMAAALASRFGKSCGVRI